MPLTTPNRSADLGIVQVIPEQAQTDPATAELVRDIRDGAGRLEERHGVTDLIVTGHTAVTIDVSDRLRGALLPFGLVVVGLSLLLLMVVFRSVAVPVKATLGYLLSVAASFGAVVAVFEYGWFADALNVEPGGAGDLLPADHPHGRALRPGHGLRGLPGLPDARGLRPPGDARRAITTGFTSQRPGRDRGRGDHDLRLRGVRARTATRR